MSLRAKFICSSVLQDEYGNEVARLRPAHGPGNESWSKATPSGSLEMMISNKDAQGKFVPGQAYFIAFTAVES